MTMSSDGDGCGWRCQSRFNFRLRLFSAMFPYLRRGFRNLIWAVGSTAYTEGNSLFFLLLIHCIAGWQLSWRWHMPSYHKIIYFVQHMPSYATIYFNDISYTGLSCILRIEDWFPFLKRMDILKRNHLLALLVWTRDFLYHPFFGPKHRS